MSKKEKAASKLPSILAEKHPIALDLVQKMLKFDPDKRNTIDEALKHPFIKDLHDPNDEPIASKVDIFDF